jgi:hypothetical protein
MRRVYHVFMMRAIAPFAFDCLVIVIAAFAATLFVSVQDVWDNFLRAQSSGQLGTFSFSALEGTELTTKILLLIFGVAGFIAYKHLKRAVRAVRTIREKPTPPQSFVND